jgi:hypothetical protein
MSRTFKKYAFMALLAVTLVGCQHVPRVGVTIQPSPAEVKLMEINKEHERKQAELQKQIDELAKSFQVKFDDNISLGSANVWASLDTLVADPDKDKYTLAAIPALEVAKAALPQPTVKDLQAANASQRKLLSEQAEQIKQAKEELEAKKQEALASKEAQKKILEEKAAIEKAKSDAEVAHGKEVIELKDQAIKEKNELAAAKQKEVDDAKAAKDAEMKKYLIKILMGIGILAAIIAFVVKAPGSLMNTSAALVSAGAIGLAVAIGVLPTWAWITGLGVLFGGIIWALLHPLFKYKEIAKVGVGAIQEQKNENPEQFKATLATKLKDWTGGKAGLEKDIDKLAEELNVK